MPTIVLLSIFNSFFFRSKSNPSIPAGFTIFCSVINFYNSLHNTKLQFQPPLFLKWHLCWDVSSYLKKTIPFFSHTLYFPMCFPFFHSSSIFPYFLLTDFILYNCRSPPHSLHCLFKVISICAVIALRITNRSNHIWQNLLNGNLGAAVHRVKQMSPDAQVNCSYAPVFVQMLSLPLRGLPTRQGQQKKKKKPRRVRL